MMYRLVRYVVEALIVVGEGMEKKGERALFLLFFLGIARATNSPTATGKREEAIWPEAGGGREETDIRRRMAFSSIPSK